VARDDRPNVYWDKTSPEPNVDCLIIRASAIGHSCLYELIAAGQGFIATAFPDMILAAFDAGVEGEPVVIQMLRDLGWEFDESGFQEEGHLVVGPQTYIRFHPDGRAVPKTKEELHVVEVKVFSEAVFRQARSHGVASTFAEYAWQLSSMMITNNMPGVWVYAQKDKDGVVRPDAPLGMEFVSKPPVPYVDLIAKAAAIRTGVEGKDLDMSPRPCDDPNHWPCRYLYLRPEPEEEVIEAIPAIDEEEFESLISRYQAYAREVKVAKEADEARARLRDDYVLRWGSHRKLRSAKKLVTVVPGKSVSYDFDKMRKDGVDLDKYKKVRETPYITVKDLD